MGWSSEPTIGVPSRTSLKKIPIIRKPLPFEDNRHVLAKLLSGL